MAGMEVLLGLGIATNAMWLIQNAKLVVFGKKGCRWCKKLKLYTKKLQSVYRFGEEDVVEVDIDAIKNGYEMFDEISKITGNDTVPQVFVDETYVGGYPEFKKMYKNRQLHKMLKPVLDPISGPKRIKEKPCINCKKSQEELKHERIRKLEEMLKKADDDLLFLNNAISIPILDA